MLKLRPPPPFKISCYATAYTASAVREFALQQLQIIQLTSFLVSLRMQHRLLTAVALLKIIFSLTVLKNNVDDN